MDGAGEDHHRRARLNINADIGDVGVRGNIGVQMQHTDQSSDSRYWDSSQSAGNNVQPYSNGRTYNDWLPSLNLAFLFPHQQTLRFAVAKQVARPRVDQMRAGLEFGVDTGTGRPGGSGGNPLLDPWRATALDLSYEKYFGEKAYVAAAIFYKDLKSYVYTQSVDNYDFTALLGSYVPPPGMTAPVLTTGTFSAPQNGKGGTLKGLELTASFPLEMLTDSLRGFGVQASATFNKSDITIPDPRAPPAWAVTRSACRACPSACTTSLPITSAAVLKHASASAADRTSSVRSATSTATAACAMSSAKT